MSKDVQPAYIPSTRFENQNGLYGNHFRFTLESLPDLTFFAQTVQIPNITVPIVDRGNPFTKIREVGDHLNYGSFQVTYLVDSALKTYSSLYWWIKGYGFPHSYDEVKEFREVRRKRSHLPNPQVKDLEKTNAVLTILLPDIDKTVAEIQFIDVVPTTLGEIEFSSIDGDAPILRTVVTFECTAFELVFP